MPISLPPEENDDPQAKYVEESGKKFRVFQHKDFIAFRDFVTAGAGFKLQYDSAKIKVYMKPVPQGEEGYGLNILKVECDFPGVPPSLVYDALHDPDFRKTWDDHMIIGDNICQLDPHNDIGHYACKFPWPLSNREYVNMRCWMEFDNGEYIIMNRSVLHPSIPETSKYVRAISYRSGYYLIPSESGGTRLLFMTLGDPMGSIPKSVLNYATSKTVPGMMTKLETNATNYEAWSAKNYPPGFVAGWRTPKRSWDPKLNEQKADRPVSLLEGGMDGALAHRELHADGGQDSGAGGINDNNDDDQEQQSAPPAVAMSDDVVALQRELEEVRRQLVAAQRGHTGGGSGGDWAGAATPYSNLTSLAPVAPRSAEESHAVQQYRAIMSDALNFVDRQYIQEGRVPTLAEYLTRLKIVLDGVRRTTPATK